MTENRNCDQCGTFHLKNISFFAYWVQCKECGLYLCQDHSGLRNSKITQYAFLGYLLISMFYYFGIFIIITPIKDPEFDIVFSYLFAGFLLIIPFIGLLFIIKFMTGRFSHQPGVVTSCPKCNSPVSIIYHDIFLYFWLFLIHVLYIATISNEIGIFFYKVSGEYSLTLGYVIILIGIIIPIIWFFKQIGGRLLSGYKMNTRVWLGEILAIFLCIAISVILLPLITTDDSIFSFNLFYYFTSIVAWYFPAFLIGSAIYKLAQRYFLNVNKSYGIYVLLAILFIISPFYLWGFVSYFFGIYFFSGSSTLPFYSIAFNEVIPLLIISLVVGVGISSIYRTLVSKSSHSNQILRKIPIILGISLFAIFFLFENIYYLITKTFFLDIFISSVALAILIIFLISCLLIIFYEIIFNWANSETRWGKALEKKLGSLLYPILLGFIIVSISLGFSSIIPISSSLPIASLHPIISNTFLLKIIFTVGFLSGLFIGLKK